MLDLKGPYDLVEAARVAYESKAAEIADLLNQGTDEATAQALALQDSLDTLQADYESKKSLYAKLVQANQPSNVTALFVPASPTATESDEKPKVMKRSDWDALDFAGRAAFIQGGGKLED